MDEESFKKNTYNTYGEELNITRLREVGIG